MSSPKSTTAARVGALSDRKRKLPLRSRVRHGSPSCADYGCDRPECTAAARRDRARRTSDLKAGRPARVSSAAAAAKARELNETGLSAADIAALSGVAVTLVRRLLRPADARPVNVHRVTAEAILGIPPNAAFKRRRLLPGLVEADRAATCLQDLAERGWPTSFLAAELHTTTHTVAAIRNRERPRIALALDRRIQRLAPVLLSSGPADYGIAECRSRRARAAAQQRTILASLGIPVPRSDASSP
ncbi:hypothetical protein [Streptomyces sp. NPDC054865]